MRVERDPIVIGALRKRRNRTVAGLGDYSALMPAALIMGHHFSISAF